MRAEKNGEEAIFVKDTGSAIIHGDIEGSFTFTYIMVFVSDGSTEYFMHVISETVKTAFM